MNTTSINWVNKTIAELPSDSVTVEKATLDILSAYPVGSVYLTVNDKNPGDLFGGSWEKVKGGFLYGCHTALSDNLSPEIGTKTAEHVLTIDQVPKHSHMERLYFHGYSGFSGGSSGNVYVFNWSSGNCIVNQNSSNTSSLTTLCNQPNTAETGGGGSHNHDIPHIGVWVWKRIG